MTVSQRETLKKKAERKSCGYRKPDTEIVWMGVWQGLSSNIFLLLYTRVNLDYFCLTKDLVFQYLIFAVAKLNILWTGYQITENRDCL